MSFTSRMIARPVAVAMLFLAVVFLGAISFKRLPIDLLPEIAYPKLVIYTSYPNVAPAEVERLVTEQIERNLAGVPGVEQMESSSREGVSLITLRFGWGTDMDFAALDVREKLDNVTGLLPAQAARPIVLRTDPTAEPIMALSIAGRHDLRMLRELGESIFKRRLEQLDGVAQAPLTGGLEREIHVEVDPRRLESFGITIGEIENALQSASATAPAGTILRGRYRYSLRTIGELRTVDEIGDIIVKRQVRRSDGGGTGSPGMRGASGRPGANHAQALISLRDIARIEDGFRERESITRYNGQDAVGMLIFKESGANSVEIAESVGAVLEELRAEYPDIAIEIAMNQAEFISEAIGNVVDALVQGGILAFLVLFLFLRDVRYPITIALAIPISVIATFALLDLAGVSLNIMSLGGLALGVGMLVDNSIVVLENIFRHREMGVIGTAAAATGTREVITAIIGATLTTIAVFGPIIYVEGIAGQLFGVVSYAVSFALLASLVVAMLLVPTITARWGTDGNEMITSTRRNSLRPLGRRLAAPVRHMVGPPLDAFDRLFARFTTRYEESLGMALRYRGCVVLAAATLLALAIVAAGTLDRAVLPNVEQGTLRLSIELPRGSPIEETTRVAAQVEAIFSDDPTVDAIFTRVGRQDALAGIELDESGLHTALIEIRLGPNGTSSRALDRARDHLATFPPGVVSVDAGQATALGRLLGGGESELTIRVRGDDLDQSLDFARHLVGQLATTPELTNVRLGTELGQPEIRVEIDRERAAAFGIEPYRIAGTIQKYMLGSRSTDLVDFDRKIPIVVRLPDEARRSLETLDLLRIDDIPLRELVRTHEAVGPTEIRRIDQARLIPIYADGAGPGLSRAITAAQEIIALNPPPAGVRVEIGGENEELRRSSRNLAFAFILAILLVYMILAAEFESLVHPFTVLLSIPLAVVGAILALRVTGAGFNAMSLIGIVILVGIAVNNAIVMVDFVNKMRKRGLATRAAILESARARLRPIVMTTATTLLGILPMAIGIGRGAELRAPLAIAIFGGLFTSTGLTLIVVPVAYDLIDEARRRFRARFYATASEHPTMPAEQAHSLQHAPAGNQ